MLERQGIEAAVTSVSSPGVHFGDGELDLFDDESRREIEWENALCLLPRLADRVSRAR